MKYSPTDIFDENKIIYEDSNFVLHIDPKHSKESFHYTAWHKRDVRSLLEVKKTDIEDIVSLLDNIKDIIGNNFVSYIHFPPNFWRLHIHFINVDKFEVIKETDNDIYLLENIISNINEDEDYYRKRVTINSSL